MSVSSRYSIAYTQILEILKYLPKEEYQKIPKEEIEIYEKNKDDNYTFSYNPNLSLAEQMVSVETKAILVSLYRDYFLTNEQKTTLTKILYYNEQIKNKKQKEKYDIYEKFPKNKKVKTKDMKAEQQLELIPKEKNFFKRIFLKIKNFFQRSKYI